MLYTSQQTARSIDTIYALSFRCTLMILHLSRMHTNVSWNVYSAVNVSLHRDNQSNILRFMHVTLEISRHSSICTFRNI